MGLKDDEEEEQDLEYEPKSAIPWITGFEAFQRYSKPVPVLKTLVKAKKVRMKKINGKDLFSVEDLENLSSDDSGDSSSETSMADLVNAARGMMGTAQTHHEKMFDKYMAAFDSVQKTLLDALDKGNKHILNLEEQAMQMREAAEKVFNLEHTRKLEEMKEERTRAMQTKAMEQIAMVAPLILSRFGLTIPGFGPGMPTASAGETPPSVDPRLAAIGHSVLSMIVTMTDEQFAKLGEAIPADEFSVLVSIRGSVRQ